MVCAEPAGNGYDCPRCSQLHHGCQDDVPPFGLQMAVRSTAVDVMMAQDEGLDRDPYRDVLRTAFGVWNRKCDHLAHLSY